MYEQGAGGLLASKDTAAFLYAKAAQAGLADAQFNLAVVQAPRHGRSTGGQRDPSLGSFGKKWNVWEEITLT